MGGPLFLRASAGSGKTYRLTLEYLKILLHKPEHFRSILAITFTNDATAEMKSRIQEELRKLAKGSPGSMVEALAEIGPPALLAQRATEALQLILHDYTHFSVMTIDGFFQMVLRSFSRELQLPMGYAIELDHDNVLQYAIQSLLAEIGRETTLTNWLIEYAKNNLEEGKTWNIEKQTAEVAKELFKEISQHREWEKTEVLGDTLTAFQQELWKITRAFEQRYDQSWRKRNGADCQIWYYRTGCEQGYADQVS
jgi:ATP-dependent helicase/nuclease subunit A